MVLYSEREGQSPISKSVRIQLIVARFETALKPTAASIAGLARLQGEQEAEQSLERSGRSAVSKTARKLPTVTWCKILPR